jgi:hypothetical protein
MYVVLSPGGRFYFKLKKSLVKFTKMVTSLMGNYMFT